MAGLVPTLTGGSFQNWLKGALGIHFAKEGLIDFVSTEFTEFHTNLLNSIWTLRGIPSGTTCNSCTTANLLKCHTQGFCNPGLCKIHDKGVPEKVANQNCPNRVCDAFVIPIRKNHRYKGPSWKNTDARNWFMDPFELAKCFLPPDGYKDIHRFEETDFNGILSVIINNKRFQSKLTAPLNTDPNSCTKARDIGKAVRHSPDLSLTDADLAQYIIDLIDLLTDPKYLVSDLKAQTAVKKLKELQANTLTIHANDITQIIHDNIGRSISTRHQAVLQDIQNHFCAVTTASVKAIDEIITAKFTALDEISKETEQKKTEINEHTGQKKHDFDEHAGLLKKYIDVHADKKKQDIDMYAKLKEQDIDIHTDQKKQDIDVHADQKKEDIEEYIGQKMQDIDVHANQKKQDIDVHADEKKEDIEVHIGQKMQDIDMHANQKKQDIDVHADEKKEDIEVNIGQKMQVIDMHANQKKQDIDVHADEKKEDIEVHIGQKMQDLYMQANQKKQDIDVHVDEKKEEIEVHIGQKMQDIDMHANQKKQDIDVHADEKKEDIEVHIGQKMQDIDMHANQKKQDIVVHADEKKEDIEVHIGQKMQEIDMHANQKKQDIDVHADEKKEYIEVHIGQKMQDIDMHANQKKQDIDVHADEKMKDIEVHIGQKMQDIDMLANQKKQDIDVHADEKKEDIEVHIGQKMQDIDMHANQKKQDIDAHADQKKKDMEVHICQKMQDIDMHANQKKQDIVVHADEKKEDIEVHIGQKMQDIDMHANQKKQDIDVHADQKKEDIEEYIGQKMQDFDMHNDQKKQDIDVHADKKMKNIDVHADQKKQEIDIHGLQTMQDIDVHADQKKKDIEVYSNKKEHDIKIQADYSKQDINVLADIRKHELDVSLEQNKQDINVHAEQKKEELDIFTDQKKKEIAFLGKQELKTVSQIKEQEFADFQSELIKMYRKHNSKIPLSPIAEEHDVPLVDLYVEPPLSAIDLQQWRGDRQGNPVKTPVNDYKELLFLHGENVFKNIYITANAGIGKTVFSSHLCMTWCQAHDPDENLSHHFRTENLQALKFFEFVFLIPLREAQRSLCDVDNFICEFVQNCLPNIQSSCELVDDILNCKKCLIILDGLDEWVHPKCEKPHEKSDIPHAKCWSGCTVVTTSRPWKFDVIRLPSSKVDRHVEICELNRRSYRRLVLKAIKLLNDRSTLNKPEMKIADFDKATSDLGLGNLGYNPYIILQIVTLWHDGGNIGQSWCEFFTNIVGLTLERGLAKIGPGPISAVRTKNCNKPKCLKCKDQCHKYFALLYNLGKLAFVALFCMEQESALIIERSVALQYLDSEDELEFSLKLGLLSQNKDYRYVSRQQSKIVFQHKTFQEYFAALYIQSDIERESARENILKKCISLESVLEMGIVFVFLSGMNPEVYERTFLKIINILSTDKTVTGYRTEHYNFSTNTPAYDTVFTFQTHQTCCLQEIEMNGHTDCFPPIEDVIINEESKDKEYLSLLETIVRHHCDRIQSLTIHRTEVTECIKILHRLNVRSFRTLERLWLRCFVEEDDLEHLLKENLKTLRCLMIHNDIYEANQYFYEMASLSSKCLADIKNMPYLQNLCLYGFLMEHKALKDVFDSITNRGMLAGIMLERIQCENHKGSCTGFMLDLSTLVNLRSLALNRVRINHLRVNTDQLKYCKIGQLPEGLASSWLKRLPASPHTLHSETLTLWCDSLATDDLSILMEILPTLNLKELFIHKMSLGDLQLSIPPSMKSLLRVELAKVSIMCPILIRLVKSVCHLAQPVVVNLWGCTVTPPEEYKFIKTVIKTSKKFHVLFDGMDKTKLEEFRFRKL